MRYSDGLCKLCNSGDPENIEHLLMVCRGNMILWKLMETVIQMSFSNIYMTDSNSILLGFWKVENSTDPTDLLIMNALIGICRYHIWKIRNCIKYGNENINMSQSIKRLKIDLESHLKILLLSLNICPTVKDKLGTVHNSLKQVFPF